MVAKKISQVSDINELCNHNNVASMESLINKYWDVDVKPHGYDELKDGYVDFDGMEDFDPTDMIKSFKGMGSSTACSPSFPEQLTTPNIVYGECCQGRSPLHSIISAVFSYAYQCGAKHQELAYVKSFQKMIDFQEKLMKLPQEESHEKQVNSLQDDIKSILTDIKQKLYFDSVVTDHSKLKDIE